MQTGIMCFRKVPNEAYIYISSDQEENIPNDFLLSELNHLLRYIKYRSK